MSLIKTLIRFWNGKVIHDEIDRSKQIIDSAQETILDVKACLDGEESWLKREKDQELD